MSYDKKVQLLKQNIKKAILIPGTIRIAKLSGILEKVNRTTIVVKCPYFDSYLDVNYRIIGIDFETVQFREI